MTTFHSVQKTLSLTVLVTAGVLTATPSWAGSLVLVGGNLQYPATGDADGIGIYQQIIDLAGGTDNAKIGIFTTASSSGGQAKRNADLWIEDFQDLGITDVEWIPIHIDNCASKRNSRALANQISSRTGFVFGGGDQSLITQCLFEESQAGTRTESRVFQALRDRFDAGAVIAGTSAGTAVQTSYPMITEGESYESILGGPTSLIGSPPLTPELYYNPLGGLGFFNYGLTDSHFSERGRQGRVIRLASDLDIPTVYGVDENTALVVTDPDTDNVDMRVIGQGGVFITDLTAATASTDDYWSISGVKATYLTEGDRYDPLTNTATFASWKTNLAGQEQLDSVPIEEDIFSSLTPEPPPGQGRANPRALTELAIDLFNSNQTSATGRSYEDDPVPYITTLSKDEAAGSRGFVGTDEVGTTKYSFENLLISIAPESNQPPQAVPEPGMVLGLLGMGAIGIGSRWKRQS